MHSRLELRYDDEEDETAGLTLRPFVDGEDLLLRHENDLGLDPDRLLPPVSRVLLPTSTGHIAVIGRCGCGEVGCGSLAASVRRVDDEVRWEAAGDRVHESLDRTYTFALRQYLDAIDTAAAAPPPEEGRGRRVARMVTVALERDEDKWQYGVSDRLDWVSAWPWTADVVRVSLTRRDHQRVHEFEARHGETDADFAVRLLAEIQRLRFG